MLNSYLFLILFMKSFSHCFLRVPTNSKEGRAASFRRRASDTLVLLYLVALMSSGWVVSARDIHVRNLHDNGKDSLRQALQDNDALGGGNVIVFDPGVVGTITLTNRELIISTRVDIRGPGASLLRINANEGSRVFHLLYRQGILPTVIAGVTIANGKAPEGEPGGGVRSEASLALEDCVVINNQAVTGAGLWAGYDPGQITSALRCLFTRNEAEGFGGAIRSYTGLQLSYCTISGNGAGIGGGIFKDDPRGALESPNLCQGCTISGNFAMGFGGGLSSEHDKFQVVSTVIAGNSGSADTSDIEGIVLSRGYNFIGNKSDSRGWGALGDQIGTPESPLDPLLGPLQYNGGPSWTMAPLPQSPLIDQGKILTSAGFGDQRGQTRTYDDPAIPNAIDGDGTDIGAYESNGLPCDSPVPMTTPVITRQPRSVTTCVGSPVVLSVEATGECLFYEWRKFGRTSSRSTQNTLRIEAVHPAQSGAYDVVVRNTFGSVVSAVVTVTVQSPDQCAGNRVINGSFELATYRGDGDVYSTEPRFGLLGWTYPTGPNQFFLEYGERFGAARYFDGRQAVCLNGDGIPVTLSQIIPTDVGHNYLLSFRQGDEGMFPSMSAVKVTIGEESRLFTRRNSIGFKPQSWEFTATSNRTTIAFSDATPTPASAPFKSPFLDAVRVRDITFRPLDFGTPIPIGSGVVAKLPAGTSQNGMNFGFYATGNNTEEGIFAHIEGQLTAVADLGTFIPGGSGKFIAFTPPDPIVPPNPSTPPNPIISGNNLAFYGRGSDGQEGIYRSINGELQKVADLRTTIPGGTGGFETFASRSLPADPCIDGQNVSFFAASSGGQNGIYAMIDGALARIADTHTTEPNGTSTFVAFGTETSISGENVAFSAATSENKQGLFASIDGEIKTVADESTAIPDGAGTFVSFATEGEISPKPVISGDSVAFIGRGSGIQQGIYLSSKGPLHALAGTILTTIADTSTAIPSGVGNFTSFSSVSISDGDVAFYGQGEEGQGGIYHKSGNSLVKIIDLKDSLDGQSIASLQFSSFGLDHALLGYSATLSDGTQAIYSAVVVPGPEPLRITSTEALGKDIRLTFTSELDHNYQVQGRADLSSAIWQPVEGSVPGTGDTAEVVIKNALLGSLQFYQIQQLP
jgi:predicted outer membrane repeat protein